MNQSSGRIDLEILAFNEEFLAIGADTVAAPLPSGPNVGAGLSHVVEAMLSTPALELGGITDRLEDACRRRGDEDFVGFEIVALGKIFGHGYEFAANVVPGIEDHIQLGVGGLPELVLRVSSNGNRGGEQGDSENRRLHHGFSRGIPVEIGTDSVAEWAL